MQKHVKCFCDDYNLKGLMQQPTFHNNLDRSGPATLLKKRFWHRCFPVNFAKFLRIPFLKDTSGRLLLLKRMALFLFVKEIYKC